MILELEYFFGLVGLFDFQRDVFAGLLVDGGVKDAYEVRRRTTEGALAELLFEDEAVLVLKAKEHAVRNDLNCNNLRQHLVKAYSENIWLGYIFPLAAQFQVI